MTEKRKPGRKAYAPEDKAVPGSIRLTPEHWALLRELGVGWLRVFLDNEIERRKHG